jgi:hypothetical protein
VLSILEGQGRPILVLSERRSTPGRTLLQRAPIIAGQETVIIDLNQPLAALFRDDMECGSSRERIGGFLELQRDDLAAIGNRHISGRNGEPSGELGRAI